jgi:hypothetical protein
MESERVKALDRVYAAARKIVYARRQADDFSPGDKAQPYLKARIGEGLTELDEAVTLADKAG